MTIVGISDTIAAANWIPDFKANHIWIYKCTVDAGLCIYILAEGSKKKKYHVGNEIFHICICLENQIQIENKDNRQVHSSGPEFFTIQKSG